MTWLTPILIINLALTTGTIDKVSDGSNEIRFELPDQMVSTEITTGALLWNTLGIEGETHVFTSPPWLDDSVSFSPFQADFYFRAYLTRWGLTLGVEHLCTHPIEPGALTYTKRYGGSDTVYLHYELGTE